jgi:hypothetical protein
MPRTSIELIVQALRAGAEGPGWPPGADHDEMAVAAIATGLAPLLHWQLETWSASLEPRAQAKLALTRRASVQREAAIHRQLAETLQALAARGLTPIVLKGAYLAAAVYPTPGLRPMNDIDLLFRPHDLPRAEQVLLELGYGAKYKPAEAGARVVKHTSTFRREGDTASTPNPYLSAEAGRTIEPHGSLEESWYGLRVDVTPGVWSRSREAALAGWPARALSPEDTLLHVAVHLVFHLIMGYPSLVQLLDMRFILDRWAGSLDWHILCDLAAAAGAAPFLYGGLKLAQSALAAPVPASALAELAGACPAAPRAQAERLTLADVIRRTQRPPVLTLRQRIAHGLAERREVARWAPTLGARWQVWRTALDVSRTDTGRALAQRMGLRA